MRNLSPRAAGAIVAACVALNVAGLLAFAQRRSTSANTDSRLATIEALVDHGTFFIDDSRYASTLDKVQLNGRFLSSKPPLLPVIGAGFYAAFKAATGKTLATHEADTMLFLSLATGVLPYLALLFYAHRFLKAWSPDPSVRALGFAAFSLNFLGLGYSTGLNNHVPAAAAVFISFYYAFLLRRGLSRSAGHWVACGVLAGMAPTFELWAGVYSLAIAVYLGTRDARRTLLLFLPAAAAPVALSAALTAAATGSIIPVYFRKELYFYRGSFWALAGDPSLSPEQRKQLMGLEAVRDPRPLRYVHFLVGHHGLLSMTPVFFLAAWSLFSARRPGSPRFPEALVALAPAVFIVAALGWRTYNYGGVAVGFRWMLVGMPPLFLFVASWLEEHRSAAARTLFAVLLLAGAFHSFDALRDPWKHSAWHRLFLRPAAAPPAAPAKT